MTAACDSTRDDVDGFSGLRLQAQLCVTAIYLTVIGEMTMIFHRLQKLGRAGVCQRLF
jgi:hypothetical protein